MSKSPETPPPGWHSREELAAIFGVGVGQIDRRHRLLAGKDVQTIGRRVYYRAATIIKALLADAAPSPDDPDGLLGGPDSPALERYRLARAKLAERDVEERDRTMVRLSVIQDALRSGTTSMRATGDRLTRGYGNEAGEIFNEGVREFEAAALRVIAQADGSNDDNGGRDAADPVGGVGDADAPAADDR